MKKSEGFSQKSICEFLGVSPRTTQRWRANTNDGQDGRTIRKNFSPANALSAEEKQAIIDTCNQKEFASCPPGQIVPTMSDRGTYLASESTFYRVLRAHSLQRHRGRARAPKKRIRATHTAQGVRQVWVWDITWLASRVLGKYFKLYVIMDLFSRKIIGWEVWEEENEEHSRELVEKTCLSENIQPDEKPVLHGDNGKPLKSANLTALLNILGIQTSYSRPRVSNDNAHAEALFRTAKYHPSLPEKPFEDVQSARKWTADFVHWYNEEHRHSALNWVTPSQKHSGEEVAILEKRKTVYEEARTRKPQRWFQGKTRNCQPVMTVSLNPEDPRRLEKIFKF